MYIPRMRNVVVGIKAPSSIELLRWTTVWGDSNGEEERSSQVRLSRTFSGQLYCLIFELAARCQSVNAQ
jgi:hypothetical protein